MKHEKQKCLKIEVVYNYETKKNDLNLYKKCFNRQENLEILEELKLQISNINE